MNHNRRKNDPKNKAARWQATCDMLRRSQLAEDYRGIAAFLGHYPSLAELTEILSRRRRFALATARR